MDLQPIPQPYTAKIGAESCFFNQVYKKKLKQIKLNKKFGEGVVTPLSSGIANASVSIRFFREHLDETVSLGLDFLRLL